MDEVERSMQGADPKKDLQMTLAAFPLARLRVLHRALQEGRMIRGKYHDESGQYGCPLYFLASVHSKEELLAHDFGSAETWWAARRVVRYVDSGRLDAAAILPVLEAALDRRKGVRETV